MGHTLFCLGDSNTYGYDPRSFWGDRYDKTDRWTGILDGLTEWTVVNAGQNGRSIPVSRLETDPLLRQIEACHPDALLVMLGSNDLLSGLSAVETAARMERFLTQLPNIPTLLIAPPLMAPGAWVTDTRLLAESADLPAHYRELARKHTIHFADASAWGISLTYDGIHFSEAGHHTFARAINIILSTLLSTE